jgi:hypothetical protein
MDIKYLTDKKGRATAVQLSMNDWKAIRKELQKSSFSKKMQQAFKEIDLIEKGRVKPKSIEQLLDEL